MEIIIVFSVDSPQVWPEKYGDLLYQYALPRVTDPVEAEDLVQETFLAALKAMSGFKGESSIKNWLFAILKNKIVDFYRKKARRLEDNLDITGNEMSDWFTEEGNWRKDKLPAEWESHKIDIESRELQLVLNDCKNKLRNLTQQVYVLKYLEDVAASEICKVLNISTSNYWILLHRARLQMRDCIEINWIKK